MRPISNDEPLSKILKAGPSGNFFSKVFKKAVLFRKYLFFPI